MRRTAACRHPSLALRHYGCSIAANLTFRYRLPASFLDVGGQRQGFVLLAAFLVSFLFIRTSARLTRSVSWWPGGVVTDGGLHLHHLVWGICLLLISGFLGFAIDPGSPANEIFAAAFGIGAGLTLDEFALWVRLKDVYWTDEGRSSLDAVVVATLFGGLVVVGLAPFDVGDASSTTSLSLTVVVVLALCVIAILKGKPLIGLIGIFIPPVLVIGSLRLASPRSPWARRRYRPGSRSLARSEARFKRIEKRRRRLLNAIGGSPEDG
jgi:hypothetical protein